MTKAFEDGKHVALTKCYVCGEASDIILHKRLGDVSEAHGKVITKEPCAKCVDLTKQGIIMLGVKEHEDTGNEPYRTGAFVVIKDEGFKKVFPDTELPPQRICFVPHDILYDIGAVKESLQDLIDKGVVK